MVMRKENTNSCCRFSVNIPVIAFVLSVFIVAASRAIDLFTFRFTPRLGGFFFTVIFFVVMRKETKNEESFYHFYAFFIRFYSYRDDSLSISSVFMVANKE